MGNLSYFLSGDLVVACGDSWGLMVVSVGNGQFGRLGSSFICSYSRDGD